MQAHMLIRAIIVDDEALAREGVRLQLKKEPDIQIIGEASDGIAAIKAIKELTPDVVFLDIQMPRCDGFEVLKRVGSEHLPYVVFVTAHNDYALKAFDTNAIDYLLKPLSPQRFQATLRRVRLALAKEMALTQAHSKVVDLIYSDRGAGGGPSPRDSAGDNVDRLAVKDRGRFRIVKTADIDWIDSAANYVQLHSGGQCFLLRGTMNELEKRLDPSLFARIHRTAIVNLERVVEIVPSESGDYVIVLNNGSRLRLSRHYRDGVFARTYPYNLQD